MNIMFYQFFFNLIFDKNILVIKALPLIEALLLLFSKLNDKGKTISRIRNFVSCESKYIIFHLEQDFKSIKWSQYDPN